MDSWSQLVSEWRGQPRGGMMSARSAHHSTGNQRSVRLSPRMEGKGQNTKAGARLVNWSECTTLGESSAHRKRAVCSAPITEIHQHHYIVGQQFFLLSYFCCMSVPRFLNSHWTLGQAGQEVVMPCGRTRQKVMRMSRRRSYQLPSMSLMWWRDVLSTATTTTRLRKEWKNYTNLPSTIQIN